jgi:hypothetical protein
VGPQGVQLLKILRAPRAPQVQVAIRAFQALRVQVPLNRSSQYRMWSE